MQMDIGVTATALREDTPPVVVHRPVVQTVPVIFASPHSGRAYLPDFLGVARLDPHSLRRSEDSFVDNLFAEAPGLGAPLLLANFPRAWCDVNREAWELDPAMFEDALPDWVNTASPRVAAGLGTIARVVATGEAIYRRKLRFAEAEARVRDCWQPYHETLSALLSGTRGSFGACLLIDCHSMPACAGLRGPVDFVLGDAHGTSCAPAITRMVEQVLGGMGYSVRRNDPYAGGYITRHYGRPREGIHVLQIELSRALYMDESRITKLPRFPLVRHDITELTATIASRAAALMG
jgi:N-formylglutamate deformylase